MQIRRARGLALGLIVVLSGMAAGADQDFVLSKERAGPVRVGMTIDALYAAVGQENTKLVDQFGEGFFDPVVEIYSSTDRTKEPSLEAQVASLQGQFVVGSVTIRDARFKTETGISVGSTLGDIRRSHKVDWITFGEGPLFARVDELSMSFALDDSQPPAEWYRTHDQKLIPDSAKVTFILLTPEPAGAPR